MSETTPFPYWLLEADFSYTMTESDGEHTGYDDITQFLDAVVTHLEDALAVEDVTLVLDEEGQAFSVSLLVTSPAEESIETVVGKGMGLLRTAFHACDGHTPGWPGLKQMLMGVKVSQAKLAAAPVAERRALSSV
ncbi:MAG: hypothetical protein QOD07_48 [Frankiaceae bacterium]|jgi:hypothetical protein|nr:hypothetical protein [Frankiaceae bacterium]